MGSTQKGEKAEKQTSEAVMMYAVWFKKPHGPSEYSDYLKEASPIAERFGARRVGAFIGVEALNGGFDPDYVYFVAWPDLEQYYAFLRDHQYRAVAQRLPNAVSKTVVLHCKSGQH